MKIVLADYAINERRKTGQSQGKSSAISAWYNFVCPCQKRHRAHQQSGCTITSKMGAAL